MDEDATAILQPQNEAEDTAAQVQQSPTLSLQLNRGNTQHTVAEQPMEETQENEGEAPAVATAADKAASTASQATSSSNTPSVASSSAGPEGDENVNNNSMDFEQDSARQVEKRLSVAATIKVQPTEGQAMDVATMPNNPSLAFHLPEHAFSGQLEGNNTVDEFAGMD